MQPLDLPRSSFRTLSSRLALCSFAGGLALCTAAAAQAPRGPRVLPPGPMLDGGHVTLNSSALKVNLLKYSGTVASLSTPSDPAFDYTPGDKLKERSADTFYHLGDLDLRYRVMGAPDAAAWVDVSTAFHREPMTVMQSDATHLTGDLSASFPAGTPL